MIPVRACVVVVLALLLPSPVFSAPCDFRRNADMRFRTTAYDVATDFTDVWVATGHGVQLWERSGGTLVSSGSIAVPGTTLAVVAAPGGVWAASGRGVYFLERARPLRIASSVQLDSDVNDLAIAGSWLYAATTTGITQIDAVDRARPAIGKHLNTTSGSALSVAILGSHLYAADGDRTIEVYAIGTPTIPQKVGTFDSLPRSLTVHASGDNLFVSDGQRAEVFGGSGATMTRLGYLPFGATAVSAGAGGLRFVAGADRTVRAINVLAPVPTVFATANTDLTTGTVNRIMALASTGDLVVAAAGDAGVAAWSLSSFASPFPSASIEIGQVGSAWIAGQRAVVALPGGGLRRYTESSGIMNPGPVWGETGVWRIQDGRGSDVLASAGSTLQLWDSATSTPASISSASLSGAITGAAMMTDRKAVALLSDRTAWAVDFSAPTATVTKLPVPGSPTYVAAGAGGTLFGEITTSGNTLLRYYQPDFEILADNFLPATVEGTSNAGIALSAIGVASAATFRGIALVSFPTHGANRTPPEPRYVPGSAGTPVVDLEVVGSRLLALTSTHLQVRYGDGDGILVSSWPVAGGQRVEAEGDRAIVAGETGFTVIDLPQTPEGPIELSLPQDAPRFFRSVERDGSLLWLVEKSRADVLALDGHGIPLTAESLSYDETIVSAAAARGNLYTLSASGKLVGRDTAGRVVAQLAINEGADQQMNGMQAVAGSLWVSLTRGCGAGGCEKKTLVVDAASGLVVTASLPGGILDVVWSGNRAWAVSDLPREIRVYDISNPVAPSLVNSAPATGEPVSVAHSSGFVWTLGSTLKRYSEALQPQEEFLAPWTADPTGRVTYVDQKVRATGDCLIIVGREHAPRVYNVASGTPQEVAAPAAAGAMRDVAQSGDSFHFLGENSLEGWTTAPAPERVRPIRR